MARKNQSPLNDVLDLAAHLPWPAGLTLAVLAYVTLHYVASRTALTMNPAELKALGKTVADSVMHGALTMLAGIFQYLLPLVLTLGAGVSFVRRRRQREWLAEVVASPQGDALERMSWQEFEGLVAAAFRQAGYLVVERGGRGPDGGVDLELYLGRDRYLVQCKQWKASKVGVGVVRELFGVMRAERAVGCFIVTSGCFTDDARAFATGRAIRLVPAESLRRMIACEAVGNDAAVASASGGPPACPKCGKAMVNRVARQGEHSGQSFWGCSDFPACRGVRAR